MKTLELIWVIIMVIACTACFVWQIIEKAPLFIIIAFAVLSILCGIVLVEIVKEYTQMRK